MNRRHSGLLVVIVGLLCSVVAAGSALGQEISSTVKTSNSIGPLDVQTIEQFVQAQVEALQSGDADAQSAARDALLGGALVDNRRGAASQAYLNLYAQILSRAMTPLLQSDDLRTRVNVGIVVGKVAEVSESPELRGILTAMLQDTSPAVVLWGLKGAKFVVPSVLRDAQLRQEDTLRAAVLPAVQLHSEGALAGPIAAEAYQVLTLDLFAGRRVPPEMIAEVVPYTQDLLASRVEQYMHGLPAYPTAERVPTQFLTDPRVWAVQSPEQRQRTMQVLSDLVGISGQWLALAPQDMRQGLAPTIEQTAKAIIVAADDMGLRSISDATQPLVSIGRQIAAEEIWSRVQAVYPAIVATNEFANLSPPPQIQFGEPEPRDEAATGEQSMDGTAEAAPAPEDGTTMLPPADGEVATDEAAPEGATPDVEQGTDDTPAPAPGQSPVQETPAP